MQPTLYLMMGFPGSGKTFVSKIIHELTGAEHMWADHERNKRFITPTHSRAESKELYTHLNQRVADMLAEGKSVIFDTNFNFYKDRENLRKIAEARGANSVILWLVTPKEIAQERATNSAPHKHTRILGDMPADRFERMASNLEPPRPDEPVIEVDGTRVTKEYIARLLHEKV